MIKPIVKAVLEFISSSNSAKHDQNCIDIHHLTLAEAVHVCKDHVHQWHASQNFGMSAV